MLTGAKKLPYQIQGGLTQEGASLELPVRMLLQQSWQETSTVAVQLQSKGLIPQAFQATLGYNLLFNDTADPAVIHVWGPRGALESPPGWPEACVWHLESPP